MTIRGTLVGGRRAGLLTATGVVTGLAVWSIAASAGVTAILIASEPAFLAIKFAGAAYLTYLGLMALVAAIRGTAHEDERERALPRTTAYRQGLLSDLSNPKIAAFFTSLLPQFGTTDAGPSFWLMLTFGLTFCVLTWLWLAVYVSALARLRAAKSWATIRRAIEAITGAVLIALGIRLATEPRPR
jgi:threonine/homoserine/homoserine lactone efflux protein